MSAYLVGSKLVAGRLSTPRDQHQREHLLTRTQEARPAQTDELEP